MGRGRWSGEGLGDHGAHDVRRPDARTWKRQRGLQQHVVGDVEREELAMIVETMLGSNSRDHDPKRSCWASCSGFHEPPLAQRQDLPAHRRERPNTYRPMMRDDP